MRTTSRAMPMQHSVASRSGVGLDTRAARLVIGTLALSVLSSASPVSAQWSRITDVPATDVFSVWTNGDTIAAGTDTSVYVSTNDGVSWKPSTRVAIGATSITTVRVVNGRLYAGTFGQGVFVSDDLGDTWSSFNQGLVGGFLDSQLFLADLETHGSTLLAATQGAGVYARDLAGPGAWSHFGDEFEPNQASNVNDLAVGGTRIVAGAGANGSVFFRDPGAPDWTVSWLNNVGLSPGRQAFVVVFTGQAWLVATGNDLFRSASGQEPWTVVGPHVLGSIGAALAADAAHAFAAFNFIDEVVILHSVDDGITWDVLDELPGVFVYGMALHGDEVLAGRADGLWRRSTATVSVSNPPAPTGLDFALAGPQPVGSTVRFRFKLHEAAEATLEVFDAAGRRVAEPVRQSWSPGRHELLWSARDLAPGVYAARLTSGARHEVIRLVRVR
jgi:hypothetical protein